MIKTSYRELHSASCISLTIFWNPFPPPHLPWDLSERSWPIKAMPLSNRIEQFPGYSPASRAAQGIQRGVSQMRVKSQVGAERIDSDLTQTESNPSQIKSWGWTHWLGLDSNWIKPESNQNLGLNQFDSRSMAESRGCAGYSSAARVAQGTQRGTSQMRVKSKVGPEPFDSHLTQTASNANQIKCWGWSDWLAIASHTPLARNNNLWV